MTAWVAAAGFIFLLAVPNFLFRFCFSIFLPIKGTDYSTSKELYFALTNTAIVFLLSFLFARQFYSVPISNYETVLSGLHSTEYFNQSPVNFWKAAHQVAWEFVYILPFFYLAVGLEGLSLGGLCICYSWLKFKLGNTGLFKIYHFFMERFLFRHIPEWHMILSDFGEYRATVVADVMTLENHLYQGNVGTYFTDKEGQLTGIFLLDAKRFQFDHYLADRKDDKAKPVSEYWKAIPGKNLYILSDKILNFNIHYKSVLHSEAKVREIVAKELAKSLPTQKFSVKISLSEEK